MTRCRTLSQFRFLKAREIDVEKAYEMITKTIDWRRLEDMATILDEPLDEELLQYIDGKKKKLRNQRIAEICSGNMKKFFFELELLLAAGVLILILPT